MAETVLTRHVLLQADVMFEDGDEQTFTMRDFQEVVEENILNVLASVVGEIRTDSVNGCSGEVVVTGRVNDTVALCEVDISADAVVTEIDAVAAAGAAVRALGCSDSGNSADINIHSREIATAIARAIAQADVFCESTGGPGTMACGMSSGAVTAVARATASAFTSGLVRAGGEGCECDLSATVDAEEVEEVIATAATSAMSQVCTGAKSTGNLHVRFRPHPLSLIQVTTVFARTAKLHMTDSVVM